MGVVVAQDATGQESPLRNAQAYIDRGNAFYNKRDYDRAIADYTQAIQLDPKLVKGYINRGLVFANKGDNDRAIADLNQATQLDPKSALAYINRGNSFINKGDTDSAIADFNQAIQLDPKSAHERGIDQVLATLQQKSQAQSTFARQRALEENQRVVREQELKR
jgi:tetratricopeptide (TPR) repeat protein